MFISRRLCVCFLLLLATGCMGIEDRSAAKISASIECAPACTNQPTHHHAAADVSTRTAARRAKYGPMIAKRARQHGVPVKLAMIVTKIESNFNPKARSRNNARGLMQLWPPTARKLGYHGPLSGLYDPETNIEWAMKELAACYKAAGGDWRKTGHCYNGGPKRTHASRLPRETRNYGKTIIALSR